MFRLLCLVVSWTAVICQGQSGWSSNRPVDCAYGPWSEYKPSLNPGEVYRTRHIVRRAKNGGKECTGPDMETRQEAELQTPSIPKFLSLFLPGDRRKVALGGSILQRGEAPRTYTLSRDVVVALDTTLFAPAVPLYKSVVSNLIGSVCGDVGRNQSNNIFSLITYDHQNVDVLHSFNDEQSKTAIQNKVLSIQSTHGSQYPSLVGKVMRKARRELSSPGSGTRPYHLSHKDVLLFVTYRDFCEHRDEYYSRQLKSAARVYVIVLGDSSDSSPPPSDWCLRKFASDQFDFHFLRLTSFQDLKDLASWTIDLTSFLNPCVPE